MPYYFVRHLFRFTRNRGYGVSSRQLYHARFVVRMRTAVLVPCAVAFSSVLIDSISSLYFGVGSDSGSHKRNVFRLTISIIILLASTTVLILLLLAHDLPIAHIVVLAVAIAFWLSEVAGSASSFRANRRISLSKRGRPVNLNWNHTTKEACTASTSSSSDEPRGTIPPTASQLTSKHHYITESSLSLPESATVPLHSG